MLGVFLLSVFKSAEVANTTLFIAFAQIGRVDIKLLVDVVNIPREVYEELITRETKDAVDEGVKDGWIKMHSLSPAELRRAMEYAVAVESENPERHLGEAAAIVLYQRIKADILIIDELKPRQIARSLGIRRLTGTLGPFLTALEKRLLTSSQIESYLDILIVKGTKISKELRYRIVLEARKKEKYQ